MILVNRHCTHDPRGEFIENILVKVYNNLVGFIKSIFERLGMKIGNVDVATPESIESQVVKPAQTVEVNLGTPNPDGSTIMPKVEIKQVETDSITEDTFPERQTEVPTRSSPETGTIPLQSPETAVKSVSSPEKVA